MVFPIHEENIDGITEFSSLRPQMKENRFYDTLLALPLFLGMSRSDLRQAAGKTRFDFHKVPAGETIVREGERCQHLVFLLAGDIDVITEADDHGYRIEEDITAPEIFQPECIFGLNQHFTHTYIAQNDCSIMRIEKQEVVKLSEAFVIFRINILNLISTQVQKMSRRTLRVPPKTLEERIIRFFESHCIRPAGKKTFYIKMTRIADEVNDSRLDVSRALNHLEKEELLELHRGRVAIPALEKLINR